MLMVSVLPSIRLVGIAMGVEFLLEPLQYSFIVRALIVSVLVGIMCPFLGAFVINREMGFMGDALAHSVLPGMVIAYGAGVSPFLGAIPNAILVALGIGYIVRKTRVSADTSIGIVFSALFSLGLILLAITGGININVEDILLGQVLSTSTTDVYVTVALTGIVISIMILFYKPLVFVGFDFEGSAVAGIPAVKLDYLLLTLLSVVIVMSLKVVGIVLVIGMLITPAAAAGLIVRRFSGVILLGIGFGVISAMVGLYASYYFNLPSGPAIALASTCIFGCSLIKKWQSG